MTERSPDYPIFNRLLGESAIAQTSDNKGVIGVPTQQPQSQQSDSSLTQIGTAAIGGAVAVTAILKLFERYGSNIIDGQKSRLSLDLRAKELELEAAKAERLAAREEETRKANLIESTLNTALSNVYQSSREGKEMYYLLLEKIQESTNLSAQERKDINDRLDKQDRDIQASQQILRDILAVLNMRERSH